MDGAEIGTWHTGQKIFTLMQQVVEKYFFRGEYHVRLREWLSVGWNAEARKNFKSSSGQMRI